MLARAQPGLCGDVGEPFPFPTPCRPRRQCVGKGMLGVVHEYPGFHPGLISVAASRLTPARGFLKRKATVALTPDSLALSDARTGKTRTGLVCSSAR